jgi:hypothetical protein
MVASSRYIPGQTGGSAPSTSTLHSATSDPYSSGPARSTVLGVRKHLPQKTYLSFKTGELGVIIAKMNTFNTEVPPEHVPLFHDGTKVQSISSEKLAQITALKEKLTPATVEPLLPTLAELILTWPPAKRFPAIDIIRISAAKAHAEVVAFKSSDGSIIDVLIEGAELKDEVMLGRKELDVNTLLVMRTFVNLFDGQEGKGLMVKEYERVCVGVGGADV